MFIKRNSQGVITAVSQVGDQEFEEFIADSDDELQHFLTSLKTSQQLSLEHSDLAMARVLEDVINLLVEQGTIRFTDLPDAAQIKLLSRRELRGQRQSVDLLDNEDDLKL